MSATMVVVRTRDVLAALLVALIWGVNFLAIDRALHDFPPLALVAVRFVLVAFPAVLFVPRPRIGAWRVVAIGLTLSAGQFGLLFLGMSLGMPTGLAPLVLQSQVLFTLALSALVLGERPTRGQLVGVAVGAAGLVVVGIGRLTEGGAAPLLPLLLTVGAALSWAVGNTITRRVRASGFSITVWSALVVPVPMALLSIVVEGPSALPDAVRGVTWGGVGALAFTVVASSLLGYGIWNSLLSRYPTSQIGPFAMVVPVVGVLAAWWALGELPTPTEAAGGVLLLAGVAAAVLVGRRRRAAVAVAPAAPVEAPLAAADVPHGLR